MAKRHLFSLNAPSNWPIKRKESVWVTRPNSGPHKLKRCIPVNLLVKSVLNYSKNARETRKILRNGEIYVNARIVNDLKFPVGIMDLIHIKSKDEDFVLFINQDNKYQLNKISKEEAKSKLCRIINKTILRKGKIQLNFYDGRNILVEKDSYKVGDTVILDLEKNKINSHLKLEKGALIYIMGGKYIGRAGKLESITERKLMQPAKIIINLDKQTVQTLKDYAFVINEGFLKMQNE